jgi:hypothetical protein
VAVGKLATFQGEPTKFEEYALRKMIGYLKERPEIGITLIKGNGKVKVSCTSDASHLPDADSKPRIGFEIKLVEGGASVITKSSKAKVVATSTMHAEIIGTDEVGKSMVWTLGLLRELGIDTIFWARPDSLLWN